MCSLIWNRNLVDVLLRTAMHGDLIFLINLWFTSFLSESFFSSRQLSQLVSPYVLL